MTTGDTKNERFLSLREVREMIGVSAATLWRWQREGRFPRRRLISRGRVAWLASEVAEWMRTRPLART
jgi:prophage regulatory protein